MLFQKKVIYKTLKFLSYLQAKLHLKYHVKRNETKTYIVTYVSQVLNDDIPCHRFYIVTYHVTTFYVMTLQVTIF